jgi:hypothetical protein
MVVGMVNSMAVAMMAMTVMAVTVRLRGR